MSFHLISTVARYEMRTLLRSWFFRIFVGLAVGGLSIFNIAMNVESSGAPWVYKALSASIPYANLIILNLGQAIVAVFLASEFLKQDKKNDTVEVIYSRSMSNSEYIIGKSFGILLVFLVLNILILLLGIGFSFLNDARSQNVLSYFIYPLLISLPTLVFILGLSFFMMVLVKNQAVTFILLLGYIALTIFYLNKKLFHIFDYIAYNVPMMYSSISGFGDVNEILYHRLIYLFLGVGLIFLTIYKLQRLPQPPNRAFIPLLIGILFIGLGGFFAWKYLDRKYSVQKYKQEILIMNNFYCHYPKATIKNCDLNLEHLGENISVKADILLENQDSVAIDTLLLALNPDLAIENLLYNNQPLKVIRKQHLILLKVPEQLKMGQQARISMKYSGKIDERICFLDRVGGNEEDNFNVEVFTLRKRYAFVQENYVCLTSESFWYPSTWIGYANKKPMYYDPDLANYRLTVKTKPGLTPISQGKSIKTKDKFTFTNENPLPKISLLIGNYVQSSVRVDSVEYSIFTLKGHDYFKESFKNLGDTVKTLIKDLKQVYEAEIGFKYPYKRLTLAEVPVFFSLDKHEYSYTSDAIQPEMVLCIEKGVAFNASDFRLVRYRTEKEMKQNNEDALPEEIQARMFKQVIKNNFLANTKQYYPFETDWRTYSLFPQYYSFITRLKPDKWPVLSVALEAYYNERIISTGNTPLWYEELSQEERINLEMDKHSLKSILLAERDPKEEEERKFQVRDLILVKGNDFFNMLRAKYGEKQVDTLFTQFALHNQFQKVPFRNLQLLFREKFRMNLDSFVSNWYNQSHLPGFAIKDITSYKVLQGEDTRYQVKFNVTNSEKVDGFITVNIEENNPNRKNQGWWDDNFHADISRKIFIPAKTSFEVGFLFTTKPERMAVVTHVSKNLPYNLVLNFPGFNEVKNAGILDGTRKIPFVDPAKDNDEIVVDNEDRGFTVQQAKNQAFLKSVISKNRQPRYKYSRLKSWNPEREWKAVLQSDFYGECIHSAYYTRAGSGERKAIWKTVLPKSAAYEVYFYLNKPSGWRRSNKPPDYNITVFHDGGTEKVNQSSEGMESGWLYLGTFQISDTAKVELSNKSTGDMIFADAVKWVLVK